jgi:DNA-binding NtrC family response regulator
MKQAELATATDEAKAKLRKLQELPTLQEFSDRYTREVLEMCDGDMSLAARVLGVGRASLYRWQSRLNVTTKGQRDKARAAAIKAEFSTRGGKL